MTEQNVETANQSAHDAAGPPPGDALKHSGLVDQPKSSVKTLVDKVLSLVSGKRS
jgi:hypothetical protein